MSVLAALRQATQAQHQELEAKAGILQRLATPTGRRDLLQAFLALYQPAEAALRGRFFCCIECFSFFYKLQNIAGLAV